MNILNYVINTFSFKWIRFNKHIVFHKCNLLITLSNKYIYIN